MADLSITAANVVASTTNIKKGTAGEAITRGQPVYKTSGGSLMLADNDDTAAKSVAVGIALNDAASGQPCNYVGEDDTFTPGATLTIGEVYVVSATAGGIAPIGDLTTGDYATSLFIAKTTSTAILKIAATQAQVA